MSFEFRTLTQDDMDQLIDLRSVAFRPVEDRDRAAAMLAWRLPYSLGAFQGGRLRSVTIMFPFGSYLGGERAIIGGLSGVATAPESRRHGLVARGLRRWFEDLHERGIGWSAEHPFEPTFYGKLGYQTVLNGHTVEVTVDELRKSAGSAWGSVEGAELVDVDSADRLQEVYSRYARRFSFMLTRDDGVKDHWRATFKRPWESTTQFAYLLEDAYIVATTEDDPKRAEDATLRVRDLAYSTPSGREQLFALLAAFEGQVDKVRLHLPPGDEVALDRSAYGTANSPELQVRIVDLAAALGALTWPEDATVSLRLTDAECPWNDGTVDVEVGSEGAAVTRTAGAEPDAAMDSATLVTLLTGATTPETLIADGRAEGSVEKLRPLARALAGFPVFKPHNDHF